MRPRAWFSNLQHHARWHRAGTPEDHARGDSFGLSRLSPNIFSENRKAQTKLLPEHGHRNSNPTPLTLGLEFLNHARRGYFWPLPAISQGFFRESQTPKNIAPRTWTSNPQPIGSGHMAGSPEDHARGTIWGLYRLSPKISSENRETQKMPPEHGPRNSNPTPLDIGLEFLRTMLGGLFWGSTGYPPKIPSDNRGDLTKLPPSKVLEALTPRLLAQGWNSSGSCSEGLFWSSTDYPPRNPQRIGACTAASSRRSAAPRRPWRS